ncbi:MAG: bifunctional trypsin-like peptidase domain-containing/SEL1-like repeat protein [Rhodospirillales bacterium]|nr:bifunctional trypsin-like peptidase domain-containing/SEL1-like repeat protein [Rhodospirillales bacterium]
MRFAVLAASTALALVIPSGMVHAQDAGKEPFRAVERGELGFGAPGEARVMSAAERANLRGGPGTGDGTVGRLEARERDVVSGEAGDRTRIRGAGGGAALVLARLLTKTGPSDDREISGAAACRQSVDGPENARRAVWRLQRWRPGASHVRFKDYLGTAFAVGPDRFVTSFHVLFDSYARGDFRGRLYLFRKGNPPLVEVSQIGRVSITRDLAEFRTAVPVEDYLDVRCWSEPQGELTALGYRNGILSAGSSVRPSGAAYEDGDRFAFAVPSSRFPHLIGMSGGPILNDNGLVGVTFLGASNVVYGIKTKYVQQLLAGDLGTDCSNARDLRRCFQEEAHRVRALALQGDPWAQYEMGTVLKSTVRRIDSSLGHDVEALLEAAEGGFWRAQVELVDMYVAGLRVNRNIPEAFRILRDLASRNDIPSMYDMGRWHYYGWATPADRVLARRWLDEAAQHDFGPAKTFLRQKY